MLFFQPFFTTWNLLPWRIWKTAEFKTEYLLENLHEEIQKINGSETTKNRLTCLDWLFCWNIFKLNCEGGIISFVGNLWDKFQIREALARRCSVKKVFLEISQNSEENTCATVYFLIKLQAWGLQPYYETGTGTSIFLWIWRNF